jgi:hypothetical protein
MKYALTTGSCTDRPDECFAVCDRCLMYDPGVREPATSRHGCLMQKRAFCLLYLPAQFINDAVQCIEIGEIDDQLPFVPGAQLDGNRSRQQIGELFFQARDVP